MSVELENTIWKHQSNYSGQMPVIFRERYGNVLLKTHSTSLSYFPTFCPPHIFAQYAVHGKLAFPRCGRTGWTWAFLAILHTRDAWLPSLSGVHQADARTARTLYVCIRRVFSCVPISNCDNPLLLYTIVGNALSHWISTGLTSLAEGNSRGHWYMTFSLVNHWTKHWSYW
jgi:hypothetical protein